MSSTRPIKLAVEIDAAAWAALGRLPTDVFRRVRGQLESLVQSASAELLAKAQAQAGVPLSVDLGDALVRCTVDPSRRILVVVGVELSEGGASEGSGSGVLS